MSSLFSAEDYAHAGQALLPRGRVWSNDPNSVQASVLLGLAGVLERIDSDAQQLLIDALPSSTVNLLPEWEASLGLPDPCAAPDATLAQRRAQIVARFGGVGGQSRNFFIGFAAAMGFEVEIEAYASFRAGRSVVGFPVNDETAIFCWSVIITSSASAENEQYFSAGQSHAGDPLRSSSDALAALACEINRLKASETTVLLSN